MSKKYWLFARPICLNDGGQTEINYYDYYRRRGDSGLTFGFKSEYKDADRPCLVIKNLFADLFTGSKVYYDTEGGRRVVIVSEPPLIDGYEREAKSIGYFFPFLTQRKEYESRFRRRKKSDKNPHANSLYDGLCQNPKDYIGAIEGACKKFFKEDATVLDKNRLNEYLVSRIEIFIDYIIKNDLFSAVERGNEDLKAENIRAMRNALESMQGNLPRLLSRLMILAGLNWEKIDSHTMGLLLLGSPISYREEECDRHYTVYCDTSKTDPSRLFLAYDHLRPDAKYYKEIVGDYAELNIKSDSPERRALAYEILTELTERYPDYGRGISLLALCHRQGYGCETDENLSRELYSKAVDAGDGSALLALAEDLYASTEPNDKMEAAGYCERIINLSPRANNELIGRAAFILGEMKLSVQNDRVAAKEYYSISAEAGYSPALHRLRMLDRPNRPSPTESKREMADDSRERHLIANGCNDVLESILAGVSVSKWRLKLFPEDSSKVDMRQVICDYLDGRYAPDISAEEYPTRSVFVFAESDGDVNLSNTLYLLDRVYAKYNDLYISDDRERMTKIRRLISSFDIYISADYETASMMTDASLTEMGEEVHFRVHICDSNKNLAEQLLYRAPLFIPTIRGEGKPRVVTFGHSDFIYSLIREATSSCYMINHEVNISAIGSNISVIENKFKQNCGGIYTAPLERKLMPKFLSYDLSRPDIDDIASGRPVNGDRMMEEVKHTIAEGNYFVVDVGSDMDNVLFAKNLRAWLLRSDSNFKRIPFIAVRCRDSINAFWIKRLHAGGFRQDPHWYNDYDFYIFGMMSDLYPSVITDGLLERIALNVHLSYDDSNPEMEIAHFWQSSYRRDSSRATALGLVYRMYDGGVFLENYRDYHDISFDRLTALAEEFNRRLNEKPSKKDTLAAAEQARWNCFMLCRGWLPATDEQMRAYMSISGHTSHKHELCKLHPYIRDWEDLDDGSRQGGSKAASPKAITLKSVADTRQFFTEAHIDNSIDIGAKSK